MDSTLRVGAFTGMHHLHEFELTITVWIKYLVCLNQTQFD